MSSQKVLTLPLPPSLERGLSQEAEKRGTTPENVALESLRKIFGRRKPAMEKGEAPPKQKEVGRLAYSGTNEKSEAGKTKMTGKTLASRFEGRVGVFDSRETVPGGARLSEKTGEKFTEILLEKRAKQSR